VWSHQASVQRCEGSIQWSGEEHCKIANIVCAEQSSESVPESIFDELRGLENALLTDNAPMVQGLLERLDTSIERVVTFRTEIGALTNTISNAEANIEKTKLHNESYKSKIEDADVTELMSDLQKEQAVLKATYKASSNLMNVSLMDFLS
jgi:flagellar hook-associated protein 3 FlgL